MIHDCLIIGGGVIGLSLAYELAGEGLRVRLLDQGQPGRAASWAGAGMLPPGSRAPDATPLDRLAALSVDLYADLSAQLREATGIDNGYRRCGAIYLARDPATAEKTSALMQAWQAGEVACHALDKPALCDLEPKLVPHSGSAFLVPEEAQVRNPRHLKALIAGCRKRGVQIDAGIAVFDFELDGNRTTAARTSSGRIEAGSFCLAAGAWSAPLAARLGLQQSVRPVRGQIALLAADQPAVRRIINEASRYLVPRDGGLVLVGSTEEESGFDCRTTAAGIASLLEFAISLVPELAKATVEKTWAGLRPASVDGLPYLGRLGETSNVFMATGHFRHGLRLAPGTARLVGQQIRGEPTSLDLTPFCPQRTALNR